MRIDKDYDIQSLYDKLDLWVLEPKDAKGPITPHHLHHYLNLDFYDVLQLEGLFPEFASRMRDIRGGLLVGIIEKGFEEGNFAKYYLEKYTPGTPTFVFPEVQQHSDSDNSVTVIIQRDKTPGHSSDSMYSAESL